MTIRDAIHEMLAGLEQGADPAEVLAEHGFENVSAEALSSALIHFAERAPMELADALAPIVTRVSPVPFGDGDLPPVPEADSILASGGDVFSLLDEIGLADLAEDPSQGIDRLEDGVSELAADLDEGSVPDGVLDRISEITDDTFGLGGGDVGSPTEVADHFDEGLDGLEEVASDTGDVLADALDGGLDTESLADLFDQVGDAADIDDLDDTDPSDLDLD